VELDTSHNAPANRRMTLRLDQLSRRLVHVAPVLRDAVEIASYVWMADRLIRRGTDQMTRMGADWRRDLRFLIPVRCRDIWASAEVASALTEALNFLSEDRFIFDFYQSDADTPLDPFLEYGDEPPELQSEQEVILFSGGLDSVAGAVREIIGRRRRAILVTHKNSKTLARRQDDLVEQLKRSCDPGRVFYAPIWVHKGESEPIEFSQRTRSFLFASLGFAIANAFNRDTVHFFENGVTSFNLPIAEHVIGTRASRTTHPRALVSFSRLFSLLVQREIRIANDFLWKTKAEVVDVLRSHDCASLIPQTISCANIRNWSMTTKQCGVCSQCIERRFGILGAGLSQQDHSESYAIDLFTGAPERGEHITLVEQHISRAERFSKMTDSAFLASFGQVFRALPYLADSPADAASRVFDLHRRYGCGIVAVVNQQLRQHAQHADLSATLSLPSSSLLAMIGASVGNIERIKDATETQQPASAQAAADIRPVKERRFVFAVDELNRKIIFTDGPKLCGKDFEFFALLLMQYRQDLDAGRTPIAHAYVPTRTLLERLRILEHTLTQRVRRVRMSLSQQFVKSSNYIIDLHDVIQSARWKGFRLNPYLIEVAIADLRLSDGMSGLTPKAS
jgi:7-cyano-7-deazaguanine synthase in queuosine biosynthesis